MKHDKKHRQKRMKRFQTRRAFSIFFKRDLCAPRHYAKGTDAWWEMELVDLLPDEYKAGRSLSSFNPDLFPKPGTTNEYI